MKNIVYALESPLDGRVYYVGKSAVGIRRPYSHNHSHNRELLLWLKELPNEPVVRILEREVEEGRLSDRERHWINVMVDRKEPLLNKMMPTLRQLQFAGYNVGGFVKERRRVAKLTQKQFAEKAGVGLRFIRDLEQGKETCRLDKVLGVLRMFGATLVPVIK